MELLITPTLLSSLDFAENGPRSWKKRAEAQLASMVRRERTEMSRPARRGIEFEDAVYAVCEGEKLAPMTEPLFNEVVADCRGGEFQKVFKRKEEFEGFTSVFYGKLDVFFPTTITDIKTTENYKGARKYFGGYQHEMYPWLAGVREFNYLVAVLDPDLDLAVRKIHILPYKITQSEYDLTSKMRSYVGKVIHGMKSRGLYDDYVNIFSNGGRHGSK